MYQVLVQSSRVCCGPFKIEFGNDLSVYLTPFSRKGNYYYGRQVFAYGQNKTNFSFKGQMCTSKRPRLSIHESGEVHIRFGRQKVGPLRIPPLSALRGQHVASVTFDHVDKLPIFHGQIQDTSGIKYLQIAMEARALSARVLLHLNCGRPYFSASCDRVIPIKMADGSTLYVGLSALGQAPLGGVGRGVTVICGWDPTKPPTAKQEFLYLRGE